MNHLVEVTWNVTVVKRIIMKSIEVKNNLNRKWPE